MSLGTKILLLILALTLGLSGLVIWLVTASVTSHETDRARAAIGQTIRFFMDNIRDRHRQIQREVRLVMEEPNHRALLEQIGSSADDVEAHRFVLAQLRDEIFGRTVQTILTTDDAGPAFHVLLDDFGDVLLTTAGDDTALAADLGGVSWPFEPVIEHGSLEQQRRYVWAGGQLYLAYGVPLSVEIAQPADEGGPAEPATHALFCGTRVDDAWVRRMVGLAEQAAVPLDGWFTIDGAVVARGGRLATQARPDGRLLAAGAGSELEPMPEVSFRAGGERFVGRQGTFEPAPEASGVFVVGASLDAALAPLRRLQRILAAVAGAVVIVAFVCCRAVARLIAEPVEQLVAGTGRIARGEFGVPIESTRRDELGQLARSFNQMAAGLEQRDLIKETFGKFVDPTIVEAFLSDPARLGLGGEHRVQTVLFSDLANFTSLSEGLDPEQLVTLLNRHLGDMAGAVAATRGIVDKFIGDAVMAFWGPPLSPDHAADACRAALRSAERTRAMADACREIDCPPLHVRIGIATGEVLVGNIGSPNKYNYTVMGDTVNLGSRLEGLNKVYGTQILTDGRTAELAGDAIIARRIDRTRVAGRSEAVDLHEVLAEAGDGDEAVRGRCADYAEALGCYESRDWAGAGDAFAGVVAEWPDDGPARLMIQRCAAFRDNDPGPDWDGVREAGGH
ncbi:MAG: adenylate/guanylate cyclase domain-containing protein [bacterium]|nr:adenylate/guanylate cyclase domain-containing protein [bacterium]